MFPIRWRWNAARRARFAARSAADARFRHRSSGWSLENLLAAVFPDQLACLENIAGDRVVPDHPLVQPDDRGLPARRRWTSRAW